MLQIAGLAAILNEINPKLAEKLQNALASNVKENLVIPISKSYKHGYINGFTAGILTGIIISGAAASVWLRRNNKIDLSRELKDTNKQENG